ncbi:sulfurtransferase [Dyadobacter tibetensis]|uniref:sulfurtransferase n=1 Tax=Dyadobacter tibetensis TaxID=1211851 RepID=UPI00046EC64A|nr:sulfurtransferase [Dyadobacter tibetensis]
MTILSAENVPAFMASGDTVIIDARGGADSYQRYLKGHLENAFFADLDTDLSEVPQNAVTGGRHPLPAIDKFAELLGKWGVTPTSKLLVYDDKNGAMASARLWWMVKSIGHQDVSLISGGLSAIIAAGLPITTEPVPLITDYTPYPCSDWQMPMAKMDEVSVTASDPQGLVIDVRENYRYNGESEPIDLVAGHIPGAINIPFTENLDQQGHFKMGVELAELYKEYLVNKEPDRIIIHCGSGVTACHTLAALEEAGITGAKLYVGSWSEWSRNDRPIATVG